MGEVRLGWDEYAAAWADQHGGYDLRRASSAARLGLRLGYHLGRAALVLRMDPAMLTTAGLLLAMAVPFAADHGVVGLLVAAALVVLVALAGTVGAAVAVLTVRPSSRRGVYDPVADRLGEAFWLAAFWVVGVPGPLVVTCGGLTWLHEYVRARAVTGGLVGIGAQTVAERPLRVSMTVVGLGLAAVAGGVDAALAAGALTVVTAAWLVLAVVGFGQLVGAVRRAPEQGGQPSSGRARPSTAKARVSPGNLRSRSTSTNPNRR